MMQHAYYKHNVLRKKLKPIILNIKIVNICYINVNDTYVFSLMMLQACVLQAILPAMDAVAATG